MLDTAQGPGIDGRCPAVALPPSSRAALPDPQEAAGAIAPDAGGLRRGVHRGVHGRAAHGFTPAELTTGRKRPIQCETFASLRR